MSKEIVWLPLKKDLHLVPFYHQRTIPFRIKITKHLMDIFQARWAHRCIKYFEANP